MLHEIESCIRNGSKEELLKLVMDELQRGNSPQSIYEDGICMAMKKLGEEVLCKQAFIPDLIEASKMFEFGYEILNKHLENRHCVGKVVIGCVEGELHSIGKTLVMTMMKVYGMDVRDLGINVPYQKFIQASESDNADIICMSSLLTNTMNEMKKVIDELSHLSIRDKYFVMVGGAPITQEFSQQIGADVYTDNAIMAAKSALQLLERKNYTEKKIWEELSP